jgi:hypothetical protein
LALQVTLSTTGTVALRNTDDTAPPELVVPQPLTIAFTPLAYSAVSLLVAMAIGATAVLSVAALDKRSKA